MSRCLDLTSLPPAPSYAVVEATLSLSLAPMYLTRGRQTNIRSYPSVPCKWRQNMYRTAASWGAHSRGAEVGHRDTSGLLTPRKSIYERECCLTHPCSELDAPSTCLWVRCLAGKAMLCHFSFVVMDCGGAAAASNRYGRSIEPGIVAAELFVCETQGRFGHSIQRHARFDN